MKLSLTLLALTAASVSASVPSLTPDNYAELTDGKTVFIKFFAPWCGHCKKMAPDWEKLSTEWEGNDIGLVAEVDCTAEGKPLCDANGVKGFPTLKYGDPAALDDYQGGRSLSDFQTFAKENLKPICSPAKLELCDDEKKAEISKLMAMSEEDLKAKIEAEEQKMEDAEEEFKNEVEKLQAKYQSLMEEKDAKAAAIKSSGLGLMKSVVAAKAKADKDKEL
mmetsp:Transcript_24437/g.30069  ORF Transcript_24437/g.30069 Transcript_24437/m.30069 type:complete len:221 (-) Transcript_24437:208-870(-)